MFAGRSQRDTVGCADFLSGLVDDDDPEVTRVAVTVLTRPPLVRSFGVEDISENSSKFIC